MYVTYIKYAIELTRFSLYQSSPSTATLLPNHEGDRYCSSAAKDSSLSFSMMSTVPLNLVNSSMVIACRHKGHSCLVSSHAVMQWVWK